MTVRTEQVASTLQRAIQQVLAKGLKDPRVSGLITVTGVNITPDLRTATVLVSILPEDRENLTMHGLAAAASHVRHQVADLIALKRTPELTFKLDRSIKKQAEVLDALARAAAEREQRENEQAPGDEPPGPDRKDLAP